MKLKKILVFLVVVCLIASIGLTAVACNKKSNPDSNPNPDGPKCSVSFDPRNGSETTTLTVTKGGTLTLPAAPVVNGAVFLGWYTAKTVKGTKWTNEMPVNEDMALFGVWKAAEDTQPINVALEYIAGSSNDKLFSYNLEVVPGTLAALPAIERKCYDFKGWYSAPTGGELYDERTVVTQPFSLFAHWELQEGHELSLKSTLASTCTEYGYKNYTCSCGAKHKDDFTDPLGHEFDMSTAKYNDEDDYFVMVGCSHEGCDLGQRLESTREFDEAFKYTYSESKQQEIDQDIATLKDYLASVDKYDEANPDYKNTDTYDESTHTWIHNNQAMYDANKQFEQEYYDPFIDALNYIVEQYQVGYVYYCVNDQNEEWENKFNAIQKAYTDMISTYYALFGDVYETYYREYFFSAEDGWTEEDIEKILILAAAYGGEEYKSINDSIDEIENNFRALTDMVVSDKNDRTVPNMYAEYVSYKNQLAQLSGYENYVEYAYVNEYDRDFSPADVAQLRAYAKEYMVPIFNSINAGYTKTSEYRFEGEQAKYKNAILNNSIFDSKLTSDIVGSYLKKLQIKDEHGNVVQDYYSNLTELFEVGNYFPGLYGGAFNYWIEAQQKSALYFGPGSYSGAFTFVHEFGHYNNSYYNKGTSMPFDIDETHSQGNEMMFLAYLKTILPENSTKLYSTIEYDQLFNMMAIVMLAMAVDEFEQAVYTNTYTGAMYEDGITPAEYDSLFGTIMTSYSLNGVLNDAYWRYVVIESPCYYISYSTSAMASLQLYALAMDEIASTGDFAETREKYYKLITFTDDENNAHIDFVGDTVIDIGFADILKYAGLHSVFDEDYYTFIYDYFM